MGSDLKLLTEHHLEFLSIKGGCTASSESTLVKIPHCWKSHVMAQMQYERRNHFATGGQHLMVPTNTNIFNSKQPMHFIWATYLLLQQVPQWATIPHHVASTVFGVYIICDAQRQVTDHEAVTSSKTRYYTRSSYLQVLKRSE